MKNRFSISFLILNIIFITQNADALPWPIPLQDSAHAVNKVYGDRNVIFYHNAIDIPALIGTPVLAIEGGVVKHYGIGDTLGRYNFVAIAKSLTDTTAWSYFHINKADYIDIGTIVNVGDTIGYICDYYGPGDPNDHLHLLFTDSAGYHIATSYLNPQDSFNPPIPSQIPKIYSCRNLTHHPYQIYYVPDHMEDTTNSYEKTYLHDSVDIIVRAGVNALGDTCSGVHAIGYSIQPKTGGGNIPFRKMFEMRDTIKVTDSLKYYITYADTGVDTLSRHFNNWYIVTNCGRDRRLQKGKEGGFNQGMSLWIRRYF
jgi:hypothetical protein